MTTALPRLFAGALTATLFALAPIQTGESRAGASTVAFYDVSNSSTLTVAFYDPSNTSTLTSGFTQQARHPGSSAFYDESHTSTLTVS